MLAARSLLGPNAHFVCLALEELEVRRFGLFRLG
jgi:hypothetical protein